MSQVRALDRDDYDTVVELLGQDPADHDLDFDRSDADEDFALELDAET